MFPSWVITWHTFTETNTRQDSIPLQYARPKLSGTMQESTDEMKTTMDLHTPPEAVGENNYASLEARAKEPRASQSLNHKSTKTKRTVAIAVAGVIAIAAGGLVMVAGKANQTQKTLATKTSRKPVLTVTTALPSLQSMQNEIAVHGTITAWDPVSVGATSGGLEVKKINVEEGALVKKGAVLAVLDSDQLRAQLDSERARLASAIANVTKSIQPNRQEDINGVVAAVAQAKANVKDSEAALIQAQENLKNANTNVRRYKELAQDGAVSVQEYENRATTAIVDEANVKSAQERVNAAVFGMKQYKERMTMAQIGGRKEDIDMARASVAEIQGNVRRLQTQIDQTIIKAPVDGLVSRRDVHIGDISAAGKVMFLMARDNRLELRAQVPEADLKSVKPGELVTVDSALSGNAQINGRVREISPLIDMDTRQATVRIDVPTEGHLKAGMYAEGHINVGQVMALTVPAQAVISRDEKNTVFKLHGDQVESCPVTLGNRDSNFVQISSGLSAKDPIVLDGGGFLKDGDYVAVAPAGGVAK